MSVIWVSHSSLMAVGYDCCPILFSWDGNQVQLVEKFDQQGRKAAAQSSGPAALNKFRQMDSRGQSEQATTELGTVHQNTITYVHIDFILNYFRSIREFQITDRVAKFSTTGVDGKMVIWDVKTLESSIAGLRIA